MSTRSPCSHIDIEGLRAFSKCFPANEVKSCPRNSSIDAAAVDPITDGAKSFLGAAGASQQNLRGTRSGGSVKWGGRRDRAGCRARASRTARAWRCKLSPHSDQRATGLGVRVLPLGGSRSHQQQILARSLSRVPREIVTAEMAAIAVSIAVSASGRQLSLAQTNRFTTAACKKVYSLQKSRLALFWFG